MSARTLDAWKLYSERTGRSICDYFCKGDIIPDDLINHIRNDMPLETDTIDYVQINDVQGYYYDPARILKPVFPTFAKCNSEWRYYGGCFKFETVNRF